jgi:hypothetical protein
MTNAGKSNWGVSHGTLRGVLTDKSLWTLGGNKVTTNYRYVLPTTLGAQAAGSYGQIGFRNAVAPSWGSFALFARLELSLNLQRNGYQVNPGYLKEGGTTLEGFSAKPTGNSIVGQTLELSPGYDINKEWNVSYLFALLTGVFGENKGGGGDRFKHRILNEFEVGYSGLAKGVGLAFNVSLNDAETPKKFGDLQWFKPDLLAYTLKGTYTF